MELPVGNQQEKQTLLKQYDCHQNTTIFLLFSMTVPVMRQNESGTETEEKYKKWLQQYFRSECNALLFSFGIAKKSTGMFALFHPNFFKIY
jgi:hypothetical protein